MSIAELAAKWLSEAELLRRRGLSGPARMAESFAEELETEIDGSQDEPLTIEQAARESGYSKEQLRRLIREGKVPNAGKRGAPRILRRDLPRKPGHPGDGQLPVVVVDLSGYRPNLSGGTSRSDKEYDPEEDARSIAQLLEEQP
ncbi:MAG: helix-turn-helix domain-containing protein [Candidatus Binatia bacterium]